MECHNHFIYLMFSLRCWQPFSWHRRCLKLCLSCQRAVCLMFDDDDDSYSNSAPDIFILYLYTYSSWQTDIKSSALLSDCWFSIPWGFIHVPSELWMWVPKFSCIANEKFQVSVWGDKPWPAFASYMNILQFWHLNYWKG